MCWINVVLDGRSSLLILLASQLILSRPSEYTIEMTRRKEDKSWIFLSNLVTRKLAFVAGVNWRNTLILVGTVADTGSGLPYFAPIALDNVQIELNFKRIPGKIITLLSPHKHFTTASFFFFEMESIGDFSTAGRMISKSSTDWCMSCSLPCRSVIEFF